MTGTRIYVGGLSYRVGERDIDKFFKNYKGVGDIVIKNGFAFVEFDDYREAEDAIYDLNGKELMGGRVTVEKAKGTPRNSRFPRYGGGMRRGGGGSRLFNRRPPQNRRYGMPSRTKYRLTVLNLSSKVSWQDLKDFMRQAGEVTYADAHRGRKNEGVIEFATRSDMRNAIHKLDGKELRGRNIRLMDDSRSSHNRDRSDTRSRSRSRSRSNIRYSRSRSRSSTKSKEDRYRSGSSNRSRSMTKSRSRSRSERRSHTPDNRRREKSHTPDDRRDETRTPEKSPDSNRSRHSEENGI